MRSSSIHDCPRFSSKQTTLAWGFRARPSVPESTIIPLAVLGGEAAFCLIRSVALALHLFLFTKRKPLFLLDWPFLLYLRLGWATRLSPRGR
jgi:hypothetical protein